MHRRHGPYDQNERDRDARPHSDRDDQHRGQWAGQSDEAYGGGRDDWRERERWQGQWRGGTEGASRYGRDDDRNGQRSAYEARGRYARDTSDDGYRAYPDEGWGNFSREQDTRGWQRESSSQRGPSWRETQGHGSIHGGYRPSEYERSGSGYRRGGPRGDESYDSRGRGERYGSGSDSGDRMSARVSDAYGEGFGAVRAREQDAGERYRGRTGTGDRYGTASGGFRGRGPKGYARSDERLKEDISERLSDDPDIDASDITVEVQGGMVTLTGQVESRWIKHHVENVIDRCSGVKDIENRLTLQRSQDNQRWGTSASAGSAGGEQDFRSGASSSGGGSAGANTGATGESQAPTQGATRKG